MSLRSGAGAQRLLVRLAGDCCRPHSVRTVRPRAATLWSCKAPRPSVHFFSSLPHRRHFATSPPQPPPSPLYPSSTPSSTSPPAPPTPNPHLAARDLSAEQLDVILRNEQQRRQTVDTKQQQLAQLLQQLQHETEHDEALAALTRYQRLTRALAYQQRGVKLLAVLLAVTSLACSMQLLVAKDRMQQATAAARQQLDERRDALAREERAVDDAGRRVREYLERRAAEAGVTAEERTWLEALRRRVAEVEAAAGVGAEEVRARQAVQTLERDINARHEANKRKPWW